MRTLIWPTALLFVAIGIVCAMSDVHVKAAQAGRLSPHETIRSAIDGADLSLSYGRPSMRGRSIMGRLVPYGRVWCPGADEATTLTTSKPLTIGNLTLDAGSYTLWMLPSADDWSLIVNKETGIFHTAHSSQYDIGSIVLTKRVTASPVEQLTFSLEKSESGGGTIRMTWETTDVSAHFAVVESR
jgi:hypothetical protein